MHDAGDYRVDQVVGLILAGGAGRRMGGVDKGLIELDGRPLVQWVAETLRPQVASLLISANRNHDRYSELGWPVLADEKPARQPATPDAYRGPLAGIAAALAWIKTQARHRPKPARGSLAQSPTSPAWLLVAPCDTPLLPSDLGPRLAEALSDRQARIAIAADQDRRQPLHALIPTDINGDLKEYLRSGGRSVLGWLARYQVATAKFEQTPSRFRNLNRPADAESVRAQINRDGRHTGL
jgi:molybdopterin-guanine dinucleotide biosynthesis protein A